MRRSCWAQCGRPCKQKMVETLFENSKEGGVKFQYVTGGYNAGVTPHVTCFPSHNLGAMSRENLWFPGIRVRIVSLTDSRLSKIHKISLNRK